MSVSTMPEAPIKALAEMGLYTHLPLHYQLSPAELTEQSLKRGRSCIK
jgi:hypothetical protein